MFMAIGLEACRAEQQSRRSVKQQRSREPKRSLSRIRFSALGHLGKSMSALVRVSGEVGLWWSPGLGVARSSPRFLPIPSRLATGT
ncbi:hypothetical protein HDA40_004173 [Hamadaea flava]|nr:hypothetical protein [Hamadaea flava]